jgi:putative ABC transport system permease protein
LLLTLFATTLAIVLFAVSLPFYNELAVKNIRIETLYTLPNISFVILLTLLTGLISGAYPAWFVASFHPITSLKGKKNTGWQFSLVRKGLVTFQFMVSVCMIFSTVIIYQQLQYFHHKDVGFDKDQLVAVKMYGKMYEKIGAIMKELGENPAVSNFAMVSTLPGDRFGTDMFTPVNDPDKEVQIRNIWVNANFLPTFNLTLKEGADFKNLPLRKTAYILNEAAAGILNIESPIGSKFVCQGDTGEVVGIVKDFHYASLHSTIEPLVIVHKPFNTNYMLVNIRGGQLPATLQSLEKTFNALSPGSLFSYTFLDEKFSRLYESENRMSSVFQVFAGFAILISCLGLFGLSAYATQLRTKEVGIRKVLGASVPGVVLLLSKNLLKLVLLAMLLAWPLAYLAASRWLENFAYQIDIGWQVFALSGMLAFAISLLTVSYQAIKAALLNPVKSLRSE